jgi:hypothetical protein
VCQAAVIPQRTLPQLRVVAVGQGNMSALLPRNCGALATDWFGLTRSDASREFPKDSASQLGWEPCGLVVEEICHSWADMAAASD